MNKKGLVAIGALLVLSASMCFAACGKGGGGGTEGNGGGGTTTPVVYPETVELDKTLLNEYAHENVYEITMTENGLRMEGIQNLKAACSKMRFPVENGEQVKMELAVPVYEEESEDYLVSGVNMHTQRVVDIMFRGQTQRAPLAQLRIYGEKKVGTTYVNTRITYGENGESAAYDSSFGNNTVNGSPAAYADTTRKMTGNVRESTPFTLVFDTKNFFQSYIGGETDEIAPLLDESVEREKTVLDGLKSLFEGVKSVSMIIRTSGEMKKDLEAKGLTAYEASSCLLVKSLNGQSLATGADGKLKDTQRPYISAPALAEGKQLSAYSSYTYEVKGLENSEVGLSTVLYSSFSTDILSWKTLKYRLIITDPDGKKTKTDGLEFTIGKAGEYKIQAVATDECGNEYISLPSAFTAADSYRINIEGELPSTAKKNATITLPTAYVTNAEGERTDASGNAYTYTLTVKDPLDMDVEIGADGTVKLERTGMYIVTYRSTSADGTDTKEFRITVS